MTTHADAARRRQLIADFYRAGASRDELAEQFKTSRGYINNILLKEGIRVRKHRRSPEEMAALTPAIEMDLAEHPDLSLAEIGRRHDVDWNLVQHIRNRMQERDEAA
jgi:hypothetical protein